VGSDEQSGVNTVQQLRNSSNSVLQPVRAFWSDRARRKTAMWVLGALSVLILVYGIYMAVGAQRDYMKLSDKVDNMSKQIDAFLSRYPTSEVDGVVKPDLRDATQDDLLVLAMLNRNERQVKNERADAFNQRSAGLRLMGVGIIGLALAFLVAPGAPPKLETEVPSFVQDEIASGPPDQGAT
jgi:hypothetical protein